MMRQRRWIIVIGVVAVIIMVYAMMDPVTSRFAPKCLFHQFTGLQCPGCGSQRMLHALLHGDIAAAWSYNALLLCVLPLLLPMLWLELDARRHPRLYMKVHSLPVIISVALIIVAWWILRNIFGF